jgi:protoporphyrinogen IX oxidase
MWVVTLHVTFNLLWIGGLACVTFLLFRSHKNGNTPDGLLYARHALELYRGPASIGFYAAFLTGVTRVLLDPSAYMHAHWFHGKLTLALIVIALHHMVGGYARKVARDSMQTTPRGVILGLAALLTAFGTVILAEMKALLIP